MKFLSPIVLSYSKKIPLRRLTIKVSETPELVSKQEEPVRKLRNKTRLNRYFDGLFYLKDVKQSIPEKYFVVTRKQVFQHMYLVDQKIAKEVVRTILPYLKCDDPHIVCESNPGLGLITTELLREGVEMVRLYESCIEFRNILKNLSKLFPDSIELFSRDIFHISSLSYADRYDSGNRVKEMLKGIPKKPWNKDPVMTIIGPMPHRNFLRYLIKMIVFQQEIVTYGRMQMLVLMEPMDYETFESAPNLNSRSYKYNSILFQLFFNYRLLGKYNRKSFLPWQSKNAQNYADDDLIYLVKIVPNETFPVPNKDLIYLYYFIKESFRKPNQKLIPTMENWLPGIGADLILSNHEDNFKNTNIYTLFRELRPNQLIYVFRLLLNHPKFKSSPFLALIESQLLKDETVETDAVIDSKKTSDDDDEKWENEE
ncbi:hypothetical protein RN001_000658 [Aquatica leii]|uniref:rRNA adenine N(6)-methyltransferase n=1 Tax=Aquatica leii TaxID=1421715 RepID=A0AAN7SJ88_9COLE|nr:hypothetical protein RN001_000658 [Aquatica leii]